MGEAIRLEQAENQYNSRGHWERSTYWGRGGSNLSDEFLHIEFRKVVLHFAVKSSPVTTVA